MKTPSTELFDLIHSLSAQEKRFYKLFTNQNKIDPGYIKLFDLINDQEVFSEQEIKRKIGKEAGKLKKTKSYLQESILKFLEHHHADRSVKIQLQRHLQRIEVLLDKRLFDLTIKTIEKAEKLAIEYHEHHYLSIIRSLRAETIIASENVEAASEEGNELFVKGKETASILDNMVEYDRLYMLMFCATTKNIKPEKGLVELRSMLQNSFLKDERNAISIPAKLKHHRICAKINFLLTNWDKSYAHYKTAIELLEKNGLYLMSRIDFYISAISDMLVITQRLKRPKDTVALYNKVIRFIDTLPADLKTKRIDRFYLAIQINYIARLLNNYEVEKAKKVSEALHTNTPDQQSQLLFIGYHFNISLIHFFLRNYKTALIHITPILNIKSANIREDATDLAKIYNLLVHYELGNLETLPYLSKTTAYYFSKKGELKPAFKILFDFFGNIIIKVDTKQEIIQAFEILKKQLLPYCNEFNSLNFELMHWVESKISDRSFLEICRAKA